MEIQYKQFSSLLVELFLLIPFKFQIIASVVEHTRTVIIAVRNL